MPSQSDTPDNRFKSLEDFQDKAGKSYHLLPLRFLRLDSNRYIVTNLVGEYQILPRETLQQLIRHELQMHSSLYDDLKSMHLLIDDDSSVAIDLLAAKYRTKQSALSNFTSLFMLVTTLRCDHNCTYCQVTHRSATEAGFDMTEQIADKAIEFMLRSPSPTIKVEFQGGESLMHFGMVEYIVRKTKDAAKDRPIEFVIATNLSSLSDAMLRFCADHDIFISTSLDGPRELHNHNRPQPGFDSYGQVVQGMRRVKDVLGPHRISALMTTTRASLSKPREIVDEYIRHGFNSIFLRPLNPYGLAARQSSNDYTIEEWLSFYHEALLYILDLNYGGLAFREEYASLLLRRMLTPYPTGYVDLQSPAGIGISGIVINYDGAVYASDESRMLAEMGDQTFRLGSVLEDRYEDIMLSDALLTPLRDTMTEGMPGCSDCGIQPYCGSDPVRHHRTQGDMVGFKPTSDFCQKHQALVRMLIRLLEDDKASDVLRSWAQ